MFLPPTPTCFTDSQKTLYYSIFQSCLTPSSADPCSAPSLSMPPSVPEGNIDGHPSFTSLSHGNSGSWPQNSHSPVSYIQVPQSFQRCSAFNLPIARHRPSFTSSRQTSYNAWSLQNPLYLSLESSSTAPSGVAQ